MSAFWAQLCHSVPITVIHLEEVSAKYTMLLKAQILGEWSRHSKLVSGESCFLSKLESAYTMSSPPLWNASTRRAKPVVLYHSMHFQDPRDHLAGNECFTSVIEKMK